MIVVGLTGKAEAGKDVVADYLVEWHGFEKLSFAAAIKNVLWEMDPIIGVDVMSPGSLLQLRDAITRYGEHGVKLIYPAYRRYMQKLGTEGIRAIDSEFWVKALLKSLTKEAGRYVIADVRFPNEAHALKDLEGSLWEIIRPNGGGAGGHSSESWAGRLGEEFHLYNNSTVAKLQHDADKTLGLLNWRMEEAA